MEQNGRMRNPIRRAMLRGIVLVVLGVAAASASAAERVRVTTVIDGDTIRVQRGADETTVRLIGVDAPETNHPHKPVQPFGPEATVFTRQALDDHWVRLEFEHAEARDAYGRLLAYVFLEDGVFFNRELVRQGYARAFTRFPFRYSKDFRAAEREARAAGRGLWGNRAVRSSGPYAAQPGQHRGSIIGNRNSHIYHLPGQEHYDDVAERNRVYFDSESAAENAGYRRAQR